MASDWEQEHRQHSQRPRDAMASNVGTCSEGAGYVVVGGMLESTAMLREFLATVASPLAAEGCLARVVVSTWEGAPGLSDGSLANSTGSSLLEVVQTPVLPFTANLR